MSLDTVEFFMDQITEIYINLDFHMEDTGNEIIHEADNHSNTLEEFHDLAYHFEQNSNCGNNEPE